ncbi:unnamed protein product [Phaedon cochleariae]|uniref:Hemolymph juvenile hormone binding protein n=1 Tax=Phaedon cochleariae TaxID=80249 RepID=A0A9N9X5Q9_PHACE|nr:unnamed protein product [Phaedon cochleariae]
MYLCSFEKVACVFLILISVASSVTPPQVAGDDVNDGLEKEEKKLSETIMKILEHYKQPDPVGFPGVPIPDPMDIPDLKHSFSVGRMNFKKVKLYGLKKFRIEHIEADIPNMKLRATLSIDHLDVTGNYTLSTWISSAKGPFSIKLTKVEVTATAALKVERNGVLDAQEMDMDIKFKEIAMDFRGLGFFASMFQGVMNSVGTFVFDSVKPFVLGEANKKMRQDVNKEVSKFEKKFPNSISPLDDLMCELRKKVRNMGYDPYMIPAYNSSVGVLEVFLTHTWLYGLSSFHRTRDIKLELKNKTLHAFVEVGTGQLKGTSQWEVSLVAGLLSEFGSVEFTVDYIKVQVNVSQTMDTSHPPALDDIQIEMGNIQIRFDGLGTVDYLIEAGVNILPNVLRYQIMDALERPIKLRVQEELDRVNIEELVLENADMLDNVTALTSIPIPAAPKLFPDASVRNVTAHRP